MDKFTSPPGALVGPKAPFKEPGVPLTYKSYNKMGLISFHIIVIDFDIYSGCHDFCHTLHFHILQLST